MTLIIIIIDTHHETIRAWLAKFLAPRPRVVVDATSCEVVP